MLASSWMNLVHIVACLLAVCIFRLVFFGLGLLLDWATIISYLLHGALFLCFFLLFS